MVKATNEVTRFAVWSEALPDDGFMALCRDKDYPAGGVLLASGNGGDVTLFKTRAEARQAISRTRQWAKTNGFKWASRPFTVERVEVPA